MRVSDVKVISFPKWCEIQAKIHSDNTGKSFRIRYCFPPALKELLDSDNGDPFVPALLLPAMRLGEQLEIPAPVSSKLFAAAPKIQSIYRRWDPKLSEVPLKVPIREERSRAHEARNVGLFFSCGVDSCYSLFQNTQNHPNDSRAITDLIVVKGFDIFFSRRSALFTRTLSNAARVAQETGKRILPIAANLREFGDKFVDWGRFYHGAAMASIALALKSYFRMIYIASSHARLQVFPWGSHPDLDPLWSTDEVLLIHDGCEATRMEKVRFISRFPVVLQTLRVCTTHSYSNSVYNCGLCGKCLRTMIMLQLASAIHSCQTFPRSLDIGLVRSIYSGDQNARVFLAEAIAALGCSEKDSAMRKGLMETLSAGAGSQACRFLLEKMTQFVFTFVPCLAPAWREIDRALARLVP